jgi:hypothetical protein
LDYKSARVDLHLHSTASDGSLPPADIAALAVDRGIKAIALTDHDSMEGVKELLRTGTPMDIELLSGVEISAAPPPFLKQSGSVHLLGYGMDVHDPDLNQALNQQQSARINRTPKIIDRLNALGIESALSDIEQHAGNPGTDPAQLGRPHIARWMIAAGYADSMDDAFDRYLGKGQPAYVDKARIAMAEAIGLIRAAGGLAVLAHPGLLALEQDKEYEQLIVELMSMGLQGIEVYYPKHSAAEQSFFESLAAKLGLVVTGGSDFHGDSGGNGAPEVAPGSGTGELFVPYRIYEAIIEKLKIQS